jgi:NAD+ synthase (glutamine-hydrolysing)
VTQHFEDIGHSGKKDVVYENAQARERAQILLDIANAVGGIVVGTGDLSEAALGFTTFAGDHIANYNVNASITKTALRALVRHVAEARLVESDADALMGLIASILETPVSPELLPAGEDGGPGQKTEEILAPYELLDFFLYYFLKYRFSPAKLLLYACAAFGGKYEPHYIKEKLRLFVERFYAAQFKRSCSPDSAALTEINLSGFYMPSDLDPSGLLAELDNTEI